MRTLTVPLFVVVAALGACDDGATPASHQRADEVVVTSAVVLDAGPKEAPAPAAVPLAPLSAPAARVHVPDDAWVLRNTWPSPEAKARDILRNTSERYVDVAACHESAKEAIHKLKLPKKRIHYCEAREYERRGEAVHVVMLMHGEGRECSEGCAYDRLTVALRGKKRPLVLDDVFFLPTPRADDAVRAALADANVHVRLDAETKDTVSCAPASQAYLAQDAAGRWGWSTRFDDVTCRALSSTSVEGGEQLGVIYEVGVDGSARLTHAMEEKWQTSLRVRPLRRHVVRFAKDARPSLEDDPQLFVISTTDYQAKK